MVRRAMVFFIQRGAELPAAFRGALLHLGAGVGNDRQSGWIEQLSAAGEEELVYLIASAGHGFISGIDGIDDEDDLHRRLRTAFRGEAGDGPWGTVFEESEVLLLEAGHGCS